MVEGLLACHAGGLGEMVNFPDQLLEAGPDLFPVVIVAARFLYLPESGGEVDGYVSRGKGKAVFSQGGALGAGAEQGLA